MIDTLAIAKEEDATTSFIITHDNIFLEDGVLKEPGLF
jgi:hypothetical protein